MAISVIPIGSSADLDTSVNSLITITEDLIPGDIIVVATCRSTTAAFTLGVASVSISEGSVTWEKSSASASRSSTYDLNIAVGYVNSPITTGATITVTSHANTSKRGAAAVRVRGGLTREMTTGDLTADKIGSTSNGLNSNTSTINENLPTTTTDDSVIVAAIANGGTVVYSAGTGWTLDVTGKTTSGSGDRGVSIQHKLVPIAGIEALLGSISATGSWAAAAISITPSTDETPSGWNEVYMKIWTGTEWVALELDIIEAE